MIDAPELPPASYAFPDPDGGGNIVAYSAEQVRQAVLAERLRCAMIAWQDGGNRCDILVQLITGEPLDAWLASDAGERS